MHKRFEELIPFYVAQTLPEDERRALEQYLAQSKEARQSLAEWRAIAAAVHRDAVKKSVELPPLSAQVRAHIQQPRFQPGNPPIATPRNIVQPVPETFSHGRRLPITLAAAIVTMVLFGGLLAYMATRGPDRPTAGQGDGGSAVAMVTDEVESPTPVTAALTASPTLTPLPTDLGIFTPVNTAAPPPTVPPPATIPPTSLGIGGGGLSPTITPEGTLIAAAGVTSLTPIATPSGNDTGFAPALAGQCVVSSRTGAEVNIYDVPNLDGTILNVLQPGEVRQTWVRSGDGWYQVSGRSGGIGGWVPVGSIQPNGDCNNLLLPSPTPTPLRIPIVTSFDVSQPSVMRGDTITVTWTTREADQVWIAYYGTDVNPETTPGWQPDALYTDLPMAGTMNITIPEGYAHPGVQIIIRLSEYDGTVRGPGSGARVLLEDE